MNKRLTIIAHLPHYRINNAWYSYEPYVREIEVWANLFDVIDIHTEIKNSENKNSIPLKILPSKCNVQSVNIKSGPGLKNNLVRLLQLPFAVFKIFNIILNANFLHLRSPGITTFIANYLNIFFNKKSIVKWATVFEIIPQMTLIQKAELKYLKRPVSNTRVLIYGKSSHPNHIPFLPALMTIDELADIDANFKQRDWSKKIRLICVGRLFRFKNFDTVILGLIQFKKRYPKHNWELILIGDGEDRVRIEKLILDGNLKNEVILKGKQPFNIVTKWFSKSHIAIMPGKYEGWPKIINEAWATGCIPFVVNFGNATYPFIYAGLEGFTYEPNDDDFATQLNKLFNLKDSEKLCLAEKGRSANSRMSLYNFENELAKIIDNL
jgi:glycosyltransferase involved in cell wall biosynthesis